MNANRCYLDFSKHLFSTPYFNQRANSFILKYLTIGGRVIQMGYSFPIVAVNGNPRFAGGIDFEVIQKLIKEIIEEK